MTNKIVLRVQCKAGRFVLDDLVSDSPLVHLQQLLERKTGIQPSSQKVLYGYPPKEISSYDPTTSLSELSLTSGQTLIVSELSQVRQQDSTQTTPRLTDTVCPSQQQEEGGERRGEHSAADMGLCYSSLVPPAGSSRLARRTVPADNSCLFRCISYLIINDRDSPSCLRQVAAGVILSNPHRYSSAVLGRTSEQYVQWLLKEESWGGAIELSVFSDYYHIELDVVDVQSQRIDRFGEDRGYSDRALLIYDGIHYDPLVLEETDGSVLQTVFPVTDSTVLTKAHRLATEAFQARQYTDVGRFSLRCLSCGTALRGQTEARNHATTTGHINFGEV